MKKLRTHLIGALAVLMLPVLVAAQAPTASDIDNNPLTIFIRKIITFINDVMVPLVFAVAFIAFLWGVFNYFIVGGADEEKRETGKKFAMWGIIALFVMTSVWGLVNLLVGTFSFGGQTRPDVPTFDQKPKNTSTFPTNTFERQCTDETECDGRACVNGVCAAR